MPSFNWAVFALVIVALAAAAWIVTLLRGHRSLEAGYVSFGFLAVAGVNAAAPFRGLLDADYAGYSFGLLHARDGWAVTGLAGAVLVLALGSMLIAARNRPCRAMWLAAAASLFFLVNLGVPWVGGLLGDPDANRIQFGEYLTIPGPIASILIGLAWVLPFLVGVPWLISRTRPQREPAVLAQRGDLG